MMPGYNLHLTGAMGAPVKLVGKIVPFQSGRIYHYWADPADKRHDIGAWGMREAVCALCASEGVEDLFIYDKVSNRTYATGLGTLCTFATPGKTDMYGATLNLALPHWSMSEGKLSGVAFIPDTVYRLIAPTRQWAEWRNARQNDDADVISYAPDVTQPSLLGDLE